MNMYSYGQQQNGWIHYPTEKNSSRKKGDSKAVLAVVILILLVVLVCAVLLVLLYLDAIKKSTNTCTCPASSTNGVFFPYGSDALDTDDESPALTQVRTSTGFRLFDKYYPDFGIVPGPKTASVSVGEVSGTKLTKNFLKVHGYFGVLVESALGDAERHIYHRRGSPADRQLIGCLVPWFDVKEVFIYTWEKVLGNFTTLGISFEELGTFQIVVAFNANSEVLAMRNYGTDVTSAADGNRSFKIALKPSRISFYTNLTAADVRGTRQIYDLSFPYQDDSLYEVTEQTTYVCNT